MAKKRDMKAENKTRYDGWENTITGVNVKGRDKRLKTTAFALALTEPEAEAIYAGDFIAAKMVDTLPEDMVREGFKLVIPDFQEADIRKIDEYMETNLHWKPNFQEAMSWARLYGGSALLLGVEDGQEDLSKPLAWDSIKRFDFMTLFHRWELTYTEIQTDPSKERYGLPDAYRLQPRGSDVKAAKNQKKVNATTIHASRLIRFDGCKLPRRNFITNNYWHDSILSKRKMALADYSHSFDSTAALMGDVSQAIFKIKNLHEILSSKDGAELLTKRLELMDMARSVINAMMISDEEEFERKTTTLTGIGEILTKMENRLVATSEYPHTILLGEAPGGGLGETGKSELRDYYDSVARKQETILKPALRVMIKAMFLDQNGPTKGKEPESWDIEFHPLWQDRLADTLDQREKQARIDDTYIKNGVASPDEIAESRFGSGAYSHETNLAYERLEQDDNNVSSDTKENSTPGAAPGKPDLKLVKPNPLEALAETPNVNQTTSPTASLNGAQVTSLVEVINAVAAGSLPRDAGINIIKIAFALSEDDAEKIMSTVGKGFVPKTAAPETPANPRQGASSSGTSDADDDDDDGDSDLRNLRG